MPIYKGNVEIDKVYKGATKLDNIQLGNAQQWIGIIVTPDPIISVLSSTHSTLTIRLTNTHTEEVTIFYEANNINPNAFSEVVPASSFVDRTITGLSIGSAQTIYAYSLQTSQLPSTVVSLGASTLAQVAPTITRGNPTWNSITFTVRNNNVETSIVRIGLNSNPSSSTNPSFTLAPNEQISSSMGVGFSTNYSNGLRAASFINNISGPVAATSGFTTPNPPVPQTPPSNRIPLVTASNGNTVRFIWDNPAVFMSEPVQSVGLRLFANGSLVWTGSRLTSQSRALDSGISIVSGVNYCVDWRMCNVSGCSGYGAQRCRVF